MINPDVWEEVMCSEWVEDSCEDGGIPVSSHDYAWDERYKLKEGAPESVKQGFASLREIHDWAREVNVYV